MTAGLALAIAVTALIVLFNWRDIERDGWPARYKRQRADLTRVLPSRTWRKR